MSRDAYGIPKRGDIVSAIANNTISFLIAVIIIGCVALLATCEPNPAVAVDAAVKAGFSEVRVVESGVFTVRCSNGDTNYYIVRANNPKGSPVEMTVCCGIFKACTIRF